MHNAKEYVTKKLAHLIAFVCGIFFEWIKVTFVLLSIRAFLFIAEIVGMESDPFCVLLHNISSTGLLVIYGGITVYEIYDSYKFFGKT